MQKWQLLTSPANPLLKEVRRAVARGGMTADGACVADTVHLLEEALQSNCVVTDVFATEHAQASVESCFRRFGNNISNGDSRDSRAESRPNPDLNDPALRNQGVRFYQVSESLLHGLAGTENPQGLVALVQLPKWNLDQLLLDGALVVILDGVQDPGNLGAIARAAEAFCASGLVLVKGTVNAANGKSLRASAGSLFRLPWVSDLAHQEVFKRLRSEGFRVLATVPGIGPRPLRSHRDPLPLDGIDLTGACALVVGSEGRGVSQFWLERVQLMTIPTEKVESLNASVAAGIALYEAYRQRTKALAFLEPVPKAT